jgi:hypothetical protein
MRVVQSLDESAVQHTLVWPVAAPSVVGLQRSTTMRLPWHGSCECRTQRRRNDAAGGAKNVGDGLRYQAGRDRMKLHFPPPALDGVKTGDSVTIELGMSASASADTMRKTK